MGFLTRCKRLFLFAFLLQFCNMLFSFFLKTFLILFEKQHRYAETDGTLILTVESVDFAESFVCYNIREIVFTVQDDNTLVLQTELCASVPGAVFSRMA